MISVETDYERFLNGFKEIGIANGLSKEETDVAEVGAAEWYYAWPCRGDSRLLRHAMHGESQLLAPDYRNPFVLTLVEMVARWVAFDMGRPQERTCNLALKRAIRS
jgi:hypothetical protein